MKWLTRFTEKIDRADFEWVETFLTSGLSINIRKCKDSFKEKRNHDKIYRVNCSGAGWKIQQEVPLPEEIIPDNEQKREFCSNDYGACLEFVEAIKREAERKWG